ncbi:DUF2267 domain-containing protein [Tabrizicola fusiformis]|uniref:DUF2267 domain-containing protein n=1 Tax=Tabrizicola sp. SY72 TaxID=2741673 RepID=UPI0015740B38|nr:DUF2267 domain-containing protein [Tabrizicola sp. SY72]NTT86440.1 DUF2267 domain-containing protein [Tabrizicola sp. SY72]
MPMPWTYRQATQEWQAFLADAQDAMGLSTDHSTFTAVEGVLRAFRARLTPAEAIAFAQVLPAVLRAIFVADWDITLPPKAPGSRADWTAEAQALRRHHNIAPAHCVAATALALHKAVLREDLDRALAALPPFAAEFWSVPGADPANLGPRIV